MKKTKLDTQKQNLNLNLNFKTRKESKSANEKKNGGKIEKVQKGVFAGTIHFL